MLKHMKNTIKGQVLLPGDESFEEATRPWNLAVRQPVRAVVTAEDADDVAAVVRHARLHGLTVTAQASGHGASGDVDGVILLRTGRLGEIEIRPGERTARVGAGVLWGELQAAASEYGLTGLPGSSPVVPVVGYTLGGGLGWFSRKYGFAADAVRSFDVVDADGVRSTVTAESDAELFWALRGGGGDYALVTAMEFDLHPIPALYGGRLLWPAERAPEVLAAFREITTDAPDELTVWLDLLQFPGAPAMVSVDSTFLGGGEEARALLSPLDGIADLISDSRGPLPLTELGSITAEPTDPGPGLSRGELLTDLDDVVAKALLERPIAPLLSVQLRQLGGALARPGDGGASGVVEEPYLLHLFGIPGMGEVGERQEEITRSLVPYTSGRKPYTFLTRGERAAAAFSGRVLDRLREIKRDRDPRGVFRANYPVLG